jgi:hypothetical protein
MNTQTNWFAYFRAVEAAREKREAKFGRLPWWWFPCLGIVITDILFLLWVFFV